MKEALEKSIKENAKNSSRKEVKPDEALKYSQAALNAAHVLAVLSQTDKG